MVDDDKGDAARDVEITDVMEIKLTFVGSPADSFARKARKRMPTLRHVTEQACALIRHAIEQRLGTGSGMRFTLLCGAKVLSREEKLALLAEHAKGEADEAGQDA